MLFEHQHPKNKSMVVSVIGVPNVGKSTLINKLIGTELSIVSNRPQTTRNKFLCVFNVGYAEIVLVDTPGFHRSGQELNKRMNQQAREGSEGADLNLLLIDITGEILKQLKEVKEIYQADLGPTWLVFTKSDLVERSGELPLTMVFEKAKEIIPSLEKFFLVSSIDNSNINQLVKELEVKAPSAPHLFPDGSISNKNERFFASEFIREQTFHLLKDELPYEIAVTIDEYREFKNKNKRRPAGDNVNMGEVQAVETAPKEISNFETDGPVIIQPDNEAMISASIHVNRQSQRAIVIGSQGSMIKEIGIRARKKIEAMTGSRVHLNLHVKVSPKWFKNNFLLEEIGLPRAQDSARVWRRK